MTRRHEANSFDDHCRVMQRAVQGASFAFDDSFETATLYRSGQDIPANRLLLEEDPNGSVARCYGEFRFVHGRHSDQQLRVSVQKRLSLSMQGARRLSRPEKYKYQVYFSDKKGRHDRASLIRFDCGDDTYGFPSPHHMHIQIDSVPQHRVWPHPVHIGDGFPHLSDIFDIALAMAFSDIGPVAYFESLLGRFKKISHPERADPALWVARLGDQLFEFLLP